jgi:hypothetical protein
VHVYFHSLTAVVKFKFLVVPLVHAFVLICGVFQITGWRVYGIAGHDCNISAFILKYHNYRFYKIGLAIDTRMSELIRRECSAWF